MSDRLRLKGFAALTLTLSVVTTAWPADTQTESAIEVLRPETETYITAGMQKFDLPGLAIGIVANDKLAPPKGSSRQRWL